MRGWGKGRRREKVNKRWKGKNIMKTGGPGKKSGMSYSKENGKVGDGMTSGCKDKWIIKL